MRKKVPLPFRLQPIEEVREEAHGPRPLPFGLRCGGADGGSSGRSCHIVRSRKRKSLSCRRQAPPLAYIRCGPTALSAALPSTIKGGKH